ncbi:unknown [Clostridium sp. CAG:226]|nr:unknown [Clostridium sp. CAG:226]
MQPLSAGGIGKILHYVPPKLCIGGLKTGRCGIKKAKAVVMLRREYYIFHAGAFCCARPADRIIELRIKFVKIAHIVGFFHLLRTAHPFAARRYGIKPPMDKHAEARIKEPFHAAFVFIAIKAVHLCLLSAFALFLQPYFGLSACSSPLSVFRW